MIKVKIDIDNSCFLDKLEIQYIFETLCISIGIPWCFLAKEDYSPCDVYYGIKEGYNASIFIKAAKAPKKNAEIIEYEGLHFIENKNYSKEKPYETFDGEIIFNNDIIYNAFYLLTGEDESNIERNKWDQHNIVQSILYEKSLHKPIVNEYGIFIKNYFIDQFEFIANWPNGKKAALMLSHDVDYPEIIKPIEVLRYLFSNRLKSKAITIWNILIGKESFWLFDKYMALEESYGAKSAFYFSSFKGNLLRFFMKAPDPFYSIKKQKYKSLVKVMKERNFEVGLHSSYLAYLSAEQFKSEVTSLKKTFKLKELGHRHHYWHTNPEDPSETCFIHQEAGLAYDSSMSFEQHSGFRYSICTPFHLWNKKKHEPLNIIQLPPTLMDDHLFGYKHLSSFSHYEENIDSLLQAVIANNGIFVADFHVRVLNQTFFPNWGVAYEYLLKRVQKIDQFYIETPLNIQKFCLNRELLIRNKSRNEDCSTNK